MSKPIDFENIHWGSFTKQFNSYKRKHPEDNLADLEAFAKHIAMNPTNFNPTTIKRASFYQNVIKKGGGDDDSSDDDVKVKKSSRGEVQPINHSAQLKDLFGGQSSRVRTEGMFNPHFGFLY
jgi:hypothetical protein